MRGMSTSAPPDSPELALRAHIQRAAQARTPLRIQGGGSKAFWQASASNAQAALPLLTDALQGVVAYAPTELVVTVRAGTRLAALEALLAEQGQCLPFEPPHYAWGEDASASAYPDADSHAPAHLRGLSHLHSRTTVGGMVAAGWAGPARVAVGGVRDYVLGVHLINGRGELLQFGGQVMKNVAGYDVSRLMVGSHGSLGLLTQVSLKVLPIAPAEATLVFALSQAQALEHLHRWCAQPLPINASRWQAVDAQQVQQKVQEGVKEGGAQNAGQARAAGHLWLRLRGAAAAVQAASKRLLAELPGRLLGADDAQAQWAACRDHRLPFFQQRPTPAHALWRLSLPPTTPVLPCSHPTLVEWHGGLRWLWATPEHAPALQAMAQTVGGHATLFIAAYAHSTGANGIFDGESHNPCTMPPPPATSPANQALDLIAQRVRLALDPHGVFAPARLA
jgi:glycolate oxidase FAD binding subunit